MALVALNLKPAAQTLRQFGLVGLIAFGVLAALALRRWGLFQACTPESAWWLAGTFATLAAYCGLGAAFAPPGLWPLYVLLVGATFPIGLVVSHVLMAIIYFLIITPVGLFFRLIGRDALHRKFELSADTYWIPRRRPTEAKRYFRQF